MSEATITTDHDAIRRWIEARGGRPAVVAGTDAGAGSESRSAILQVDFPDRGDDPALDPIDWDGFFACFEAERLAFLHQDRTANGRMSRYSRFVQRQD
jgi:hypothetical protein